MGGRRVGVCNVHYRLVDFSTQGITLVVNQLVMGVTSVHTDTSMAYVWPLELKLLRPEVTKQF